ncbi:MAG TPA: alpha/beta fold hydrolase [Burkholderiaceae bacterium]|nr:alpha/beta fold hydrolase [Burkholderiaceae bacterium]
MATHDEPVEISVDDDVIAGRFITPGTLIPGVLFVHGWGGNQEQYLARAREVAALGCVCLTFDLRGHAGTKLQYETVTREHNLRDVLAAYDRLAGRRHVDPAAIALVGSSYGGYLASVVTSLRPVRWLGLRAPALYIDTDWNSPKLALHREQDLIGYRRAFVPAANNRALRACAAFGGDVLLIESQFDDIIPPAVLNSYREACKSSRSLTYRLMDGADHGLTDEADQRAYTAVLVAWLREMIAGARAGKVEPRGRPTSGDAERPESPPEAD